jgi:hypothetical protein
MKKVCEGKVRQYKERLEALLEKSLESAYTPIRNTKEQGNYLITLNYLVKGHG